MSLSIILSQVAAVPGSWYGRAANDFEAMCPRPDLRSNFVWTFLIGDVSPHELQPPCTGGRGCPPELVPTLLIACVGVLCRVYRGLIEGERRHEWKGRGQELLRVQRCSILLGMLSNDKCGG